MFVVFGILHGKNFLEYRLSSALVYFFCSTLVFEPSRLRKRAGLESWLSHWRADWIGAIASGWFVNDQDLNRKIRMVSFLASWGSSNKSQEVCVFFVFFCEKWSQQLVDFTPPGDWNPIPLHNYKGYKLATATLPTTVTKMTLHDFLESLGGGHTQARSLKLMFPVRWAVKNPGCLGGVIGDFTTQLHKDCNKINKPI